MGRRYSRGDAAAHYTRQDAIDSRIDTDTGEFDMVLASEAEASDGHIISMRGLELPAELPLQVDHRLSAFANLGTVTKLRKDKIDGLPVARGVGQIRLTGDGEALEARRDLVDAISKGNIRGVSLTWDSIENTPRRELEKSHPFHVPRDEKDARKRYGIFFEKSRAIEQSIVAVPADREALIGRSETAENALSRELWQTLADRLSDAPRSRESDIIDALERSVADLETRLRAAEADASSDQTPTPPAIDVFLEGLERRMSATTAREFDDSLGSIFERITGQPYQ